MAKRIRENWITESIRKMDENLFLLISGDLLEKLLLQDEDQGE